MFFIISLFLGVAVMVFALQNTEIITVTFFFWHLTGSLALIFFLTIITGITITTFLILPKSINNHFRYKKIKKENERLVAELRKQKEVMIFANKTPSTK